MTGRLLTTGTVLLMCLATQNPALAQMGGGRGARGPAMIPQIERMLEDAGYPLTPEQVEQLNALVPGERPPGALAGILTDEQEAALAEARREQVGNLRQRNQELREQVRDQQERVREFRDRAAGEQGDRMRERGVDVREHMIDRIAAILEKAGYPLSPEQRELLAVQEPGTRANLAEILTDEQEAALREARPMPDRKGSVRPESPGRGRQGMRGNPPLQGIERPVLPERGMNGAAKRAGNALQRELVTGIRQNFPNPFNPSTAIEYSLARSGDVRIEIINSAGQRIETLVDGYREAGIHTVIWDASTQSNGVYFCRITTGQVQETRKMLFVK